MGGSFIKHTSHFGCVSWSILLLCCFSIQWPVFSHRTLDAPFIVVFLSCRKLCLTLFLHNTGTDSFYFSKLAFSHLLPHLSNVIRLLISLNLYKDMSVMEEGEKLFLILFLLNYHPFHFPLCLYVLGNMFIWYVPQESWFVFSCFLF